MPLTEKGARILKQFQREYGKKGTSVFYAAINKGTLKGVHESRHKLAKAARRLREQMFPHLSRLRR